MRSCRSAVVAIFHSAALAAAAAVSSEAALAADSVQFNCQAPHVGQYGVHDVKYELALDVSLRQGGQIISSEKQQMLREQTRQITVLKVAGDRVVQVRTHYPKASATVSQGKTRGMPQSQPIENKTYVVTRTDQNLVVTSESGADVPEEERTLVAASMESVGRPNPLGKFLHGKTVAVGQTLVLPNEMASDLLGLRETGGVAEKVQLTLRALRQEPDRRVADFAMLVVIKPDQKTALEITGDLQLDINTCQVASANFVGPVAMEETYGPQGHTFQMHSDGKMNVAMKSHYANR
jgi:hypothetical protein